MSQPRVVWREAAVQDLEDQTIYLSVDNPRVAGRFLAAIRTTIDDLAAMPTVGRMEEFTSPEAAGSRSWQVKGFTAYRVYYRVIPDGIEVIGVVHSARDIYNLFGQERRQHDILCAGGPETVCASRPQALLGNPSALSLNIARLKYN